MSGHAWGWRKQPEDPRDYHFSAPAPVVQALPPAVDLRPFCPPVYDQGRIGSCTANAIAGALEFCMIKEKRPNFTPSRLFIYWNERDAEGTTDRDAGAVIRDGIKVVANIGAPNERQWSYDDTPADPLTGIWAADAKPRQKPNCFAYRYAKDADAIAYLAVQQEIGQLKACLAAGFPFVFGFQVFEAFESQAVAASGALMMPQPGEKNLGGHAVLCVGYDDASQRFIVRNSWGSQWGMIGFFTMPYDYMTNAGLASDFWSIRAT